MFQQRGIPTAVFPGREVRLNSLLAEPVQLETAARVGVYCLEQRLIAEHRRAQKVGAGLERIEQRRDIRPHRETVAPVMRIQRDPEMENAG